MKIWLVTLGVVAAVLGVAAVALLTAPSSERGGAAVSLAFHSGTEPATSTAAAPAASAGPAVQPASTPDSSTPRPEELPLEVRVGQLIMPGFDGITATTEVSALIEQYHLGNAVLFERNVAGPGQVLALTSSLQALGKANNAGIPLLIAVDQEGGTVTRFRARSGFTEFPSARVLGCLGDAALTTSVAEVLGSEMRAVGVNLDLAPVLDVDDNPANPVIGPRSFSSSPQTVAAMGSAFIEGLHRAGVGATGKHFPGHGNTSVDSHVALPYVGKTREALARTEFVPFQAAVRTGIDAIMTAHVMYEALDPSYPATLSSTIVSSLLREQFGFREGVVVTDALAMGAISGTWSAGEAAVLAIEAGADVIALESADQVPAIHAALTAAVRDGRISESRLDQSVSRILKLKRKIASGQESTDVGTVGSAGHQAAAARLASAAAAAGCD